MTLDNVPRAVQRLAASIGGISELARRCGVDDSRVWLWLSGKETPTDDEKFLLHLVARRAGVSLATATSTPPPHTISGIMAKVNAGEEEPGPRETPVVTYEEYVRQMTRR